MRILKTAQGNYFIEGYTTCFPKLDFLEPGATEQDISAYIAAVQGHGDIWEESAMSDAFENWADFPELRGCSVFFADFDESAQRWEQVSPAPFPRYEQRPIDAQWILNNA